MLKITKERDDLAVLEIAGKIDSEEMAQGLDELINVTHSMRSGKMLYTIRDFEWPTFSALMVEFGKMPKLFGILSRVSKVAVIADQSWLRAAAEWEGVFIPGMTIKSFEQGQETDARQWLDD